MPKGILTVTDSLDTLIGNQLTVLEYGADQAYAQIQAENAAYNAQVNEQLNDFAMVTQDVQDVYGGSGIINAEAMSEFDDPDASKVLGAYPVGFPLTRHGSKVGYTQDWLATNSVDQLAAQYAAQRTGDQIAIQSKIRRALYYPISRPVFVSGSLNPSRYIDRFIPPNQPVPLYPLLNADGSPVPIGPNGETFDGATHTHYMASDWTAGGSTNITRDSDLQAACANLTEHKLAGELILSINRNEESKVRNMPNFVPVYDNTVILGNGITRAEGALDVLNYNNRRIGTFQGFNVWVKPWTFPGYIMPMAKGDATMAPLKWRVRKGGLWKDFNFRSTKTDFPLVAATMTRDGDCSVWNRHMAVVLYVGGALYTAPGAF